MSIILAYKKKLIRHLVKTKNKHVCYTNKYKPNLRGYDNK